MDSGLSHSTRFADATSIAPGERVTLASFFERVEHSSLLLVVAILGIAGMAPGISILCGALLSLCAVQVLLGEENVLLPKFVAERSLSADRLRNVVAETNALLARAARRRRGDRRLPVLIKRAAGIPVLVLSLTLFVPIPFSNVMPAAVIAAIALACMAEDATLLLGAMVASVASLAVTAATIAAIVGAGRLLF